MIYEILPRNHEEVIAAAPKAVAHLRAQLERKRLGLIFGSGISADLKFPKWNELVEKIADHPAVQGRVLLQELGDDRSLASITQIMYGLYRDSEIAGLSAKPPLSFLQEQAIRSGWLRLIHGILYRAIDGARRKESLNSHEYLSAFLPLIKRSPMTVNYNFDDTLEQLLLLNRTPDERLTTRGYETVFKPNAQCQKETGVIYHPNGFLPSVFEDGASPDLVFADDSFQDQLISVASGQYIQLSNYLFRNTCLLVGLSLTDLTLQHLLRQNAVSNPGHVHYIVHFVENADCYKPHVFKALFEANFSAYNLYTLFLDRNGIKMLAEALSVSSEKLGLRFPKGRHKFVYYIIGSIGAGKSTASSNFRNLVTYDEWIDERRPDMAVPEETLGDRAQIEEINRWTAEQFRKKNVSVSRSENGIHLIDRCPLDPLTFGDVSERREKADHLHRTISNDGRIRVEKGHVIYLDADARDVLNRISYKHKCDWASDRIETLIENINDVYGKVAKTTICTRGRSIQEVTREIAKVIFMDEYNEVDVGGVLEKFAST